MGESQYFQIFGYYASIFGKGNFLTGSDAFLRPTLQIKIELNTRINMNVLNLFSDKSLAKNGRFKFRNTLKAGLTQHLFLYKYIDLYKNSCDIRAFTQYQIFLNRLFKNVLQIRHFQHQMSVATDESIFQKRPTFQISFHKIMGG